MLSWKLHGRTFRSMSCQVTAHIIHGRVGRVMPLEKLDAQVVELESKLLQLEGPESEPNDPRRIHVISEREKSLSE